MNINLHNFAMSRWHKINARTVNGRNPDYKSPGSSAYLKKGIELRFTREEFIAWCSQQYEIIKSISGGGDTPSIDRINPDGHYELANMRIIPLNENRILGMLMRNKNVEARKQKQHPPKPCQRCKTTMYKRPQDKWANFRDKKYCGNVCRYASMAERKRLK